MYFYEQSVFWVRRSSVVISEDLTNDTHSLAHVVEVQYGQQLVGDGPSHLTQRDGLWGSSSEDEPKVSCCSDQSSLVRRLGLVHQIPFNWKNKVRTNV